MKPGLIFDLDGTLVDSLGGIASSLNHALAESNLPTHSLGAVRGFIGNGARVLIQRGAPAGSNEELIGLLEEAFKTHYDRAWRSGTSVYEGILELLESLASEGYPLAVLSNKPHSFTVEIVALLFPTVRFEAVLGQRDGIPHKPDPTGALEISQLLGRQPQECLVIGDSTMDLQTARNAGMRAIAVTWGFHDRERLLAAGAESAADNPVALLAMLACPVNFV